LRAKASLLVRIWDSRTSIAAPAAPGYQPQQSVLNRQAGQRQTACIRYISAPHRSQTVRASSVGLGEVLKADRTGVIGGNGG